MLPPYELKNKEFSKAMRGYNTTEVDEHFAFIIEKYTELYRENDELERKLKTAYAKLDEINPDIVHLHNLHGHGCNLEMLFEYFREKKIFIMMITLSICCFMDCAFGITFKNYSPCSSSSRFLPVLSKNSVCVCTHSVMFDSVIPWNVAQQGPLSLQFPRQE